MEDVGSVSEPLGPNLCLPVAMRPRSAQHPRRDCGRHTRRDCGRIRVELAHAKPISNYDRRSRRRSVSGSWATGVSPPPCGGGWLGGGGDVGRGASLCGGGGDGDGSDFAAGGSGGGRFASGAEPLLRPLPFAAEPLLRLLPFDGAFVPSNFSTRSTPSDL